MPKKKKSKHRQNPVFMATGVPGFRNGVLSLSPDEIVENAVRLQSYQFLLSALVIKNGGLAQLEKEDLEKVPGTSIQSEHLPLSGAILVRVTP